MLRLILLSSFEDCAFIAVVVLQSNSQITTADANKDVVISRTYLVWDNQAQKPRNEDF
jgi:hypothetical protein